MYDVTIVGAGPAGISASLYIARANLKVLVLYNKISSLEKAHKIDNYYGFTNGISGEQLYNQGILQAKNLGVEVKEEEVTKIQQTEDGFIIKTTNNEYNSKLAIIATGSKKNTPKITGIDKFEGRGISYCAICDGFFYRNRSVAVLGSGNYAISETNDLINIANDITILTNGGKAPEFRANNVKIDTRTIKKIVEKAGTLIFRSSNSKFSIFSFESVVCFSIFSLMLDKLSAILSSISGSKSGTI